MGNKHSKSISDGWTERLDKEEIHDLGKMYKNLAQNSPGDTIDKDMFMKFFPLPGLLGSRLFQVFDTKDTGNIDREEFITGIAKLCRGSSDERMQFLFRMYDLNGDGYISKIEMEMLLNHFPPSVFTLYASDASDEDGDSTGSLEDKSSTLKRRIVKRVQFICNQAFAQFCAGSDKMEEAQFKSFMLAHGELLKFVDSVLQHVGIDSISTESLPRARHPPRSPRQSSHGDMRPPSWNYRQPSANTLERLRIHRIDSNSSVGSSLSIKGKDRGAQRFFPNKWRGGMRSMEVRNWGLECGNCAASYTFCGACGLQYDARSQAVFGQSPVPSPTLVPLPSPKEIPLSASTASLPPSIPKAAPSGKPTDPEPKGTSEQPVRDTGWHIKCTTPGCGWRSLRYCFQCGEEFLKSSYRGKLGEGLLDDDALFKEGFLFKEKRGLQHRRKRWFMLNRKVLKVYRSREDIQRKRKPGSIVVLQDCTIEKYNDPDKAKEGLYGLQISPNRVEKKPVTFYAASEREREEWVSALRLAAGVRKFETYYQQKEKIGHGRWSKVYRCVDRETGEEMAVKVILKADLEENALRLLSSEIAILNVVDHPNIISVQDIFENRTTIFIVMDLLNGGELYKRIQGMPRFSELNCYRLVLPLLQSIEYMHNMGIVHRDIKPENILCGDDLFDIKVADFGLSCLVLPEEVMKLPCGTLTYVAPEVLDEKGRGYGKEADLWSVGVIMHLLLRSNLPFDGKTKNEIIKKTLHMEPKLDDATWRKLSKEVRDVVRGLLVKDPRKRLTASEVLRHPWSQKMTKELVKATKTKDEDEGSVSPSAETLQLGPHAP